MAPVRPDGLVVDAGANIGLFTVFTKQRYPQARVLAIEPIPDTLRALRANLELHGVDGVTVCPKGLSDKSEQREFYYFPSMPGNSTTHLAEKLRDRETMTTYAERRVAEEVFRHETVRAPVAGLSEIMAEFSVSGEVDLLKMDIEGDEVRALHGIADADWPRIRQIVMEVHAARDQLAGVVAVLEARGYSIEVERLPDIPDGLDNKMLYARRI
ncbi:FkbM family methyltransferase [Streptomyces sp. NBC_00287]|uniref:FkbM family methyltransferase n=1 Tax=Streptomyces sp. NBC_00287 TaxID=2975702 RepID=UPI002E2B9107|nr:FkbM family methyltransferase [Streptomyces sp. NBC_00287]